ncbi:MAG: hypothetical protein E6G67_11730 [Actinobacteria bacterium]|nr:MAG: hypothetical protein E6G67_11730 [Actinomycetota bacterium]
MLVHPFRLLDVGGAGSGLGAVLRDVTGERELERAKEEVISVVSHELRTPLASIVGFAELLVARSSLEGPEREYPRDHAPGGRAPDRPRQRLPRHPAHGERHSSRRRRPISALSSSRRSPPGEERRAHPYPRGPRAPASGRGRRGSSAASDGQPHLQRSQVLAGGR